MQTRMKQRFNSFIACPCSMPGSAVKRAAMLLLLSVLTTVSVWAENDFTDNGDGTYTINNAEGWGLFCDALQDNETYNRFSGKTVYLGADIGTAQNPITRMAGTSKHDFCGTFDGQGYTLTVNISSDKDHDYTAPFSYISVTKANPSDENDSPAAIRNLHVAGTVTATKDYAGGIVGAFWGTLTIENCTSSVTINTNNKHAAGFISRAAGDTITITNCLSNVTITGTISGDGTHAGFIGASASGIEINITGCAFTGSLLGTNTTHCAGFVGYNSGTLTITHSLLAPANVTVGDTGSATFARGNVPTLSNCYYTDSLGTAQGKQRRRIIAGDYVTVTTFPTGNYTTYNVSRILGYTGGGLIYADGGVRYYGKDDPVLLSLSHSERAGYNFNHYTISAGKAQGVIITMPDEDVTVGASWDLINYNISYNFNGGALRVGDSNPVSYNVETPTFTLCEPVKNHYDFAGWYINDAFTGDTVTSIKVGTTGIINLYAKWTPVTYNISYDLAGGELPAGKSNPDSYNIESADITLNIPVKDGYIFAGWTGTDLDAPTYKVIITTGSVEDREYTATWVKAVSVNYIDENGDPQTAMALPLDGSETTLTPGWYFVQDSNPAGVDLAYTKGLSCSGGDLNIILCDGAEMTVTGQEFEEAINFDGDYTLAFYGQSLGTGSLSLTGYYEGICANSGSVIINGGNITVTSDTRVAVNSISFTMNAGSVTITCDNNSSVYVTTNFTFNGGNFSATSAYSSAIDGPLNLSWTSPSDSFFANRFGNVSLTIAEGKDFIDEEGTVHTSESVGDISDKTLRPFNGYYPPKTLIATDVNVTTATLTWEAGNDETQWQVKWSTDGGDTWTSPVTVNSTQYEMTNLDPVTTFQVQVLSVYGEGQYSYPKSITFTTHSASEAPIELASNATANAAVLSWTGFQDNYNVRYVVSLEDVEDFEDEATLANWTTISNNDANSSGTNGYGRHNDYDNYSFRFSSFKEVDDYNQYLISPELSDVLSMEFNYRGYGSGEKFKVGFSTTGNDVADFTFGDEIITTSHEWVKYSSSLPAGTKYVAINYYSDFKYYLYVDNITFKSTGSWTDVNNVTSPQTVSGLTPETKYLWQVQGIVDDDVTEWSEVADFTTNYKVSYIDENGEEQTTIAHSLNGSETTLASGWYFVQNTNPAGVDLAYTNALSCSNGDLSIILCDGAEITVNVAEDKALSISGDNRTLTIYGQSEGTGRLTVTGAVSGENPDGTIDVSNMIINGGIVNATSNVRDHAAIHSNVTLNHGQLNVGNNENSLALEGDLTVNGGQFVASSSVLGTIYFNGGTFNATAVGDDVIYLNWTSPSDRFYAGSIEDNVYIADGKIFVDEDGTLYQPENGGLSDHNPTGKTLRPFTDYEVPIDLASSPFATTATLSWTGFQDEYNVRLRDAATNVFFSEGFEGGSMPTGWSTTDSYWKITSGTGHKDHTGAATGSYNAGYYVGSYDNSDILITPAMDLSSTTSATLNFNFWNTNWSGDINTLNVYYRVDGGDWNLLYTNGQEVSSWTPVKVALEGLAANYQIGFECVGKYSYGMGIDDVVVAQNSDWTYMNNVTSPLNFTGLTPNTNYEWQVQGIHDKGVTEWVAGTFTTDELNIVLYNNGSEALDNASAVSDNNGIVAHNVTLSGRTLYKDGEWNTLCLPFNVTIDESPLAGDKVVAKVLSEKSELVGDRLTLNFNDAPKEIPAGTPFIIKWDKGDDLVNPVFENVTIDKTSRDFKFTGGTFKGNYAPLEITDDNRNDILLLSSGNRLGYAKTDRTIENGKALGACRAYFDIPSDNGVKAARQFTLNFGDEETMGIIEVNTNLTNLTNKAADAFDLQGRRIENPKKGLYIVKGKKVVIK